MSYQRFEAEQAIVSYAFTDPRAFARAVTQLEPSDFVDLSLGRLFGILKSMQSMIDLRDVNAVVMELQRLGEIEKFGGAAEVGKLANKGFFPHNAKYYVERVQHFAKVDRCRQAAQALLNCCDYDTAETADIDQAIADFHSTTTKAFRPKDQSIHIAELGRRLLARMENPEQVVTQKITTGFHCIDDAAGGFFRGQLELLSGRSWRGKTMFAANLATRLAKQGYKTVIHNLEMSALELAERGYSDIADIHYARFVQDQYSITNKSNMRQAIQETENWPLWIHENTSETIDSLVAKTEYEHLTKGIDVVFIDHLQRIENRSRRELRFHLKDCCQQFKNMARRLNIVVVLLTQLKTPANADEESEPTEADYSEAKQIVEEADLAMLLHRRPDEAGGKLIFNKVRKGQPSFSYLELDGEKQRFYERPAAENWDPSQGG